MLIFPNEYPFYSQWNQIILLTNFSRFIYVSSYRQSKFRNPSMHMLRNFSLCPCLQYNFIPCRTRSKFGYISSDLSVVRLTDNINFEIHACQETLRCILAHQDSSIILFSQAFTDIIYRINHTLRHTSGNNVSSYYIYY